MVHALPESAVITVNGRTVSANAPVSIEDASEAEVLVKQEGYVPITKTVARTGRRVAVHILLRKQP